jgi:DMSO/TMAO reductase YedYZ heme-binding membrane subunit
MPNDVKAILSGVVLLLAAILAYWSGSPIRHEFATYVMIAAVLMIIAMWVFPEAVSKQAARRPSAEAQ